MSQASLTSDSSLTPVESPDVSNTRPGSSANSMRVSPMRLSPSEESTHALQRVTEAKPKNRRSLAQKSLVKNLRKSTRSPVVSIRDTSMPVQYIDLQKKTSEESNNSIKIEAYESNERETENSGSCNDDGEDSISNTVKGDNGPGGEDRDSENSESDLTEGDDVGEDDDETVDGDSDEDANSESEQEKEAHISGNDSTRKVENVPNDNERSSIMKVSSDHDLGMDERNDPDEVVLNNTFFSEQSESQLQEDNNEATLDVSRQNAKPNVEMITEEENDDSLFWDGRQSSLGHSNKDDKNSRKSNGTEVVNNSIENELKASTESFTKTRDSEGGHDISSLDPTSPENTTGTNSNNEEKCNKENELKYDVENFSSRSEQDNPSSNKESYKNQGLDQQSGSALEEGQSNPSLHRDVSNFTPSVPRINTKHGIMQGRSFSEKSLYSTRLRCVKPTQSRTSLLSAPEHRTSMGESRETLDDALANDTLSDSIKTNVSKRTQAFQSSESILLQPTEKSDSQRVFSINEAGHEDSKSINHMEADADSNEISKGNEEETFMNEPGPEGDAFKDFGLDHEEEEKESLTKSHKKTLDSSIKTNDRIRDKSSPAAIPANDSNSEEENSVQNIKSRDGQGNAKDEVRQNNSQLLVQIRNPAFDFDDSVEGSYFALYHNDNKTPRSKEKAENVTGITSISNNDHIEENANELDQCKQEEGKIDFTIPLTDDGHTEGGGTIPPRSSIDQPEQSVVCQEKTAEMKGVDTHGSDLQVNSNNFDYLDDGCEENVNQNDQNDSPIIDSNYGIQTHQSPSNETKQLEDEEKPQSLASNHSDKDDKNDNTIVNEEILSNERSSTPRSQIVTNKDIEREKTTEDDCYDVNLTRDKPSTNKKSRQQSNDTVHTSPRKAKIKMDLSTSPKAKLAKSKVYHLEELTALERIRLGPYAQGVKKPASTAISPRRSPRKGPSSKDNKTKVSDTHKSKTAKVEKKEKNENMQTKRPPVKPHTSRTQVNSDSERSRRGVASNNKNIKRAEAQKAESKTDKRSSMSPESGIAVSNESLDKTGENIESRRASDDSEAVLVIAASEPKDDLTMNAQSADHEPTQKYPDSNEYNQSGLANQPGVSNLTPDSKQAATKSDNTAENSKVTNALEPNDGKLSNDVMENIQDDTRTPGNTKSDETGQINQEEVLRSDHKASKNPDSLNEHLKENMRPKEIVIDAGNIVITTTLVSPTSSKSTEEDKESEHLDNIASSSTAKQTTTSVTTTLENKPPTKATTVIVAANNDKNGTSTDISPTQPTAKSITENAMSEHEKTSTTQISDQKSTSATKVKADTKSTTGQLLSSETMKPKTSSVVKKVTIAETTTTSSPPTSTVTTTATTTATNTPAAATTQSKNKTVKSVSGKETTKTKSKPKQQETTRPNTPATITIEDETLDNGISANGKARRIVINSIHKKIREKALSASTNSKVQSASNPPSLENSLDSDASKSGSLLRPPIKTTSVSSLTVPHNILAGSRTNLQEDDALSLSSRRESTLGRSFDGRSVDYSIRAATGVMIQPVTAEKPKSILSSDESYIKNAIPYLPLGVAITCLVLNIFLPGFGTILSGLSLLCCGKPRVASKGDQTLSIMCANCMVGVAQLFTVTFMLVGWFWAIGWGIHMVSLSVQQRQAMKEQRAKELQALALSAFGSGSPKRTNLFGTG